jgi:hypothetical protein
MRPKDMRPKDMLTPAHFPLLSAATLLSAAKRDMAPDWHGIHARAHGCGALVVLLLVLLQYYRGSYERRLMSSPTLSSWTLPITPTAVVSFMVVLLIVFMVGSKRRKRTCILHSEFVTLRKKQPRFGRRLTRCTTRTTRSRLTWLAGTCPI